MRSRINYILVMGGPGSGKSTLGRILSNKLSLFYISKGSTSRQQDRKAHQIKQSSSSTRLDSVYNLSPNLSKNQVIIKLISNEIYDLQLSQINQIKKKDYLIQGIPKTKQMLIDWHRQIDKIGQLMYCIHLQCDKDLMLRRISNRSQQESRISDNYEDYQSKRIDRYFKDIDYVKKYYQNIGKLVNVNGAGDPNTVLQRITKALNQRKFTQ